MPEERKLCVILLNNFCVRLLTRDGLLSGSTQSSDVSTLDIISSTRSTHKRIEKCAKLPSLPWLNSHKQQPLKPPSNRHSPFRVPSVCPIKGRNGKTLTWHNNTTRWRSTTNVLPLTLSR